MFRSDQRDALMSTAPSNCRWLPVNVPRLGQTSRTGPSRRRSRQKHGRKVVASGEPFTSRRSGTIGRMTTTHTAGTGHVPLAAAGGSPADGAVGVAFLASGSRGNCTLVHSHGRGVLVDCGLSAREAVRRIADAGLEDIRIEALLLTHEHTDHVCGARAIARRLGIPVFATRGTVGRARTALADVTEVVALRSGDTLSLAGLRVVAFRTSHDAAEPVGYTFATPRGTIGIATDTGVLTGEAWEVLPGCR